ncbi:MAG: hypothetical protein IJ300_14100 [Clostridia bacterium]|nr:hypothetical protein [Clostridia bacterium]
MYLTYDEYTEMGGSLTEAAFCINLRRAEAEINKHTYRRLIDADTIPDEVKSCIWELIEVYHKKAKQVAGSASNDGVSVSYEAIDVAKETDSIIKRYLMHLSDSEGVPLLYMGVD